MKVNIFSQPFLLYAAQIHEEDGDGILFKELQQAGADTHSILAVGRILRRFHWFDSYEAKP